MSTDSSTPQQRQEINWCICPVVTMRTDGLGMQGHGVRGTAFLVDMDDSLVIGVTARHVVEGLQPGELPVLLLSSGNGFKTLYISGIENHPSEDLALLKLANRRPMSSVRLTLSSERYPVGQDYSVLGYPDDDYWRGDGRGVTLELTYSAGHVRRFRGPGDLPGIRGRNFMELSQRAGGGCSGSPLLGRPAWPHGDLAPLAVYGVYIGERTSGLGDAAPLTFGYALPFSAVADWQPQTLEGRPLFA